MTKNIANRDKKLYIPLLLGFILGLVIFLLAKFNWEIDFKYPILWLIYFGLFGLFIGLVQQNKQKSQRVIYYIIIYLLFILFSVYSSYSWMQRNWDPGDFGPIIIPGVAIMGSIINIVLLATIHICSIFIKNSKLLWNILKILLIITILIIAVTNTYEYVWKKNQREDTELAKKAVKEQNPHLCKEAHDTSMCYYKYARGSLDKSVCTRELVEDRLAACNQIGRYGTNWGANYTYN